MNFEKYIRKLAKKISSQNLFVAAKDLSEIKLFKNNINFSKLQNTYLSYLYFYKSIYEDIYANKVSKKVIENKIYEEAYAYYKLKKEDKPIGKNHVGKKRALEGIFSKDNKIKFPKKEAIKNG